MTIPICFPGLIGTEQVISAWGRVYLDQEQFHQMYNLMAHVNAL